MKDEALQAEIADLKRAGRLPGDVGEHDASQWRHPVRHSEDIILLCAGGRVGSFSAILPGWGSYAMTRSVTTPVHVSQSKLN